MNKPAFDPSKPFEAADKPSFDPSQPIETVDIPTVSPTESALRGAGQGASFGFGDELVGGIRGAEQKLLDAAEGNKQGKSLVETYREYRDEDRAKNKAAATENPKAFTSGELGGGLTSMLVPGLGEANVAKMAALGGLQGLGNSQADVTQGDIGGAARDTAIGSGIGGAAGAIIPPVVGGATKALGGMTDPEMWQNLAQKYGAKALGFTKRLINTPQKMNAAKDVAQTMLDNGVITPLSSAQDMSDSVQGLISKSGKAIGDFLKARGNGFDTQSAVDALNALKPRDSSGNRLMGGAYDKVSGLIDNAIDTVRAHGDVIPFEEANKLKGFLQSLTNWNSSQAEAEVGRGIAGAMRGAVDTSLENQASSNILGNSYPAGNSPTQSMSEVENFMNNKKIYGASQTAQDALANRLSSEAGNKNFGLTDTILGAAGGAAEMVSGHLPIATSAAMGIKKTAERYGNQTLAVGANKMASISEKLPKILQTAPQMLGKYAPILQSAAAQGTRALAVRHFLMMQNDPNYQITIHNISEGQNDIHQP